MQLQLSASLMSLFCISFCGLYMERIAFVVTGDTLHRQEVS